jgi:hypothetical protein
LHTSAVLSKDNLLNRLFRQRLEISPTICDDDSTAHRHHSIHRFTALFRSASTMILTPGTDEDRIAAGNSTSSCSRSSHSGHEAILLPDFLGLDF